MPTMPQQVTSDGKQAEEMVMLIDLEEKIAPHDMDLSDFIHLDARQVLQLLEEIGYQSPLVRARLAKLVRRYNEA